MSDRVVFSPSDAVAAEVHRRVGHRHLLLLTDFDGTLAELAPTPDGAEVSPAVRAQLDAMASQDDVTLGIVSGRRQADVARRVGVQAEFVAGLHGMEIASPAGRFLHPALPAAAPLVDELARAAEARLVGYAGVLIEHKQYALTCHVRQATDEDAERALAEFAAMAEPHITAGRLRALSGAKAIELLPAADWHKGRGVEWIESAVAAVVVAPLAVVYLGDDTTDEDAFRAVAPYGLSIGVGERPHDELINWRLAGPASVGRFFGELVGLMTAEIEE